MRGEWQDSGERQETSELDPLRVATSWSTQRLLGAALVMTGALFVLGLGIATLVPPPTQAAEPAPGSLEDALVAGEVERRPGTDDPATGIGDALSVERNGVLTPASVEHLTVVQVSVSVCDARGVGSGVVVADGLVLTAAHVVGDAALVRIDHQGTVVTGEVLGVLGDGRDVALVQVDAPMAEPLAPAAAPKPGDAVTLVGHPDGGPRTVQVGAAVPVDVTTAVQAGAGEIIGVNVSIQAGISGGVAIADSGDVVGLVVAKEARSDTALVVALPDLADIAEAALVPGECPATA